MNLSQHPELFTEQNPGIVTGFYIGKTKRRLHDSKTEHFKALARIQMNKFNMFTTAVCVLFLIKLPWPKNKSIYDKFALKRVTAVECTTIKGSLSSSWMNSPIPSLLLPLWQNESFCEL